MYLLSMIFFYILINKVFIIHNDDTRKTRSRILSIIVVQTYSIYIHFNIIGLYLYILLTWIRKIYRVIHLT